MLSFALERIFSVAPLYAYIRGTFTAAAGQHGSVHIGARMWAMVWLNGQYLGRTYVRAHEDELRYQTFDLSAAMQDGENILAVLLHAWGEPEEPIPGVVPPRPGLLMLDGNLAGESLETLIEWRIQSAENEFQPARRHNGLIGHEEHRDLREEPCGWRDVGFDDSAWIKPTHSEVDLAFVPSMLRALAEERVVPARIVEQGEYQPGQAWRIAPPEGKCYWRMRCTLPENEQRSDFFLQAGPEHRLWLDGVGVEMPFAPPLDWNAAFRPVVCDLVAGEHLLSGALPMRVDGSGQVVSPPLIFGWRHGLETLPSVEWSDSLNGVYVPGPEPQPDVDARPLTDAIVPCSLATLGDDGEVDLRVEGQRVALVIELPRSVTVLPRLVFADATAGTRVELQYSERLSDLPGQRIPAAYTDRAILRDGTQAWEISFQYKSARILIVILDARDGMIHLSRIEGVYRHYDYDEVGRFACSDPVIEQAWQICRNTVEFGSQDAILDGPWREQLLYIGDNHVHNRACYHLFKNCEIIDWQHTLYAAGQMPDGLFQPNQPCRTGPEAYRLLDQTILWPIQLEHHWLYTDRQDLIGEMLPAMCRLLNGFAVLFGGGEEDPRLRNLTGWQWVDHPGMEDGMPRSIRHDGIPSAINFLYLLSLQAVERLLHAYGEQAGAERFAQRAARLAACLHTQHYDQEQQRYADCLVEGIPSPEASVHVNLLAILAGIADHPQSLLDRVWNVPGVLQMEGPYFRVHLFDVLHRLKRIPEMLGDIRSLWGGMIHAGLTSTAESYCINGEWGASVGHPWGASPVIFLARAVAGLEPVAAGWNRTRFDPDLGDLASVQITIPTPHGLLEADLHRTADECLSGTLRVPAGIEIETPRPDLVNNVSIEAG